MGINTFSVKKLRPKVYIWILNVFNKKNAITLYRSTGKPNTTGWLVTSEGENWAQENGADAYIKYLDKERDPTKYNVPRLVRFGLILDF